MGWSWKDISISEELIGETIEKGKDMWKKEYTYIMLPKGYGYDGYCFLLSDNCVHDGYISINSDMKIELFYAPDKREEDKKYKRYKLTGKELFDKVFKDYEVNYERKYAERVKKEALAKEKRDKSIIGTIYCGVYQGNAYNDMDFKYTKDMTMKAYFSANGSSTYMNSKFQKVQNMKIKFVIKKEVSRYNFWRCEEIINAYLYEIETFETSLNILKSIYKRKTDWKEREKLGKILRTQYQIRTNTEDIIKEEMESLERHIEELKKRMLSRLNELLTNK